MKVAAFRDTPAYCIAVAFAAIGFISLVFHPPLNRNENSIVYRDLTQDVSTSQLIDESPSTIKDDAGDPLAHFKESCQYRRLGAPVCPRLFILGTQKGGTTTLFHYLARHPDFVPAWPLSHEETKRHDERPLKEVKYFTQIKQFVSPNGVWLDQLTARKLAANDYLPHFERRVNSKQWSVDSSPSYMYTAAAPSGMRTLGFQQDPSVRFIVILRDPVERAVSAMEKQVRDHADDDRPVEYDIEEVINRCIPMLNQCRREASGQGIDGLGYFHCRSTLRGHELFEGMCEPWNRGFYADALRGWLLAGYDGRRHFCVLRTTQLFDGPEAIIQDTDLGSKCLSESGIDIDRFPDWEVDAIQHANIHNTSEKMDAAGLSPATIELVENFYMESNMELKQLLHDEFGVRDFVF